VWELLSDSEIGLFFAIFEMGIPDGSGEYRVRYPTSIGDDGSIIFSTAIEDGSEIRIMYGKPVDQIEAARSAAMEVKQVAQKNGYSDLAGLLIFECGVRRYTLDIRRCTPKNQFVDSVKAIRSAVPGVPILGWETYGEIRYDPIEQSGEVGYLNTTTTVLAFPSGGSP